MRQCQMKQSAPDLNTVPDNKPQCRNLPKIYQQTTWLLFQMKCKGKHAELQDSYEQPSCGGPHKKSQRGKRHSKRKGGNRYIRQKAYIKAKKFKSVAESKVKTQLLKLTLMAKQI